MLKCVKIYQKDIKDYTMQPMFDKLYQKYNKSLLNKREIAQEFGISQGNINRYLASNDFTNIPKPFNHKPNKPVFWRLIDVAKYLEGETA